MSNRTLLEINHDYYANIDADPEGFAEALLRYIRSGDGADGYGLLAFGVAVGPLRHHTDPAPFAPRNLPPPPAPQRSA